jgi:effector-binding domain-containing protein/uncharacterized protein YndB with AHSA1/START domain
MLKKIFIILVAVIAILVVVGVFLPSSAHIERSITINAPPATVFTLVDGYSRFNEWSPWAEIDPETVYSYDGPTAGTGAKMSWTSSNPNVGTGSQQIVASEPYRRVETLIDFGAQGTAQAYFDLEPEGSGTRVTWGFDTRFGWNLFGRYLGLFFDRMIGPDYDKGLAKLKVLAESLPTADWTALDVERVDVVQVPLACVSGSSSTDDKAIAAALGSAYGQLGTFISRNRLNPSGPPLAITTSWNESSWTYDACIPIDRMPSRLPATGDPVQVRLSYTGPALHVRHVGPYSGLEDTWSKLEAYVTVRQVEVGGHPWETFVSDPGSTPESDLVTEIFWPLAK